MTTHDGGGGRRSRRCGLSDLHYDGCDIEHHSRSSISNNNSSSSCCCANGKCEISGGSDGRGTGADVPAHKGCPRGRTVYGENSYGDIPRQYTQTKTQRLQNQTTTTTTTTKATTTTKFIFRLSTPCLFLSVNIFIMIWFDFIRLQHESWKNIQNQNINDVLPSTISGKQRRRRQIQVQSTRPVKSSLSMDPTPSTKSITTSTNFTSTTNKVPNRQSVTDPTTEDKPSQEVLISHIRQKRKQHTNRLEQNNSQMKTKTIPIFYNLFIKNRRDVKRVQQLVQEQFSSYSSYSNFNGTIHGPIYIISIGYNPIQTTTPLRRNNNEETNSTSLQSSIYNGHRNSLWKDFLFGGKDGTTVASKINRAEQLHLEDVDVIHLAHYDEGMERLTLQSVWDYCQQAQNNEQEEAADAVIYLHSKGSYTPSPENDLLRRFLTKGALSPDCASAVSTSSRTSSSSSSSSSSTTTIPSCNTCSSRFSPLPHSHTSGNMWSASCDYVRRLIPPDKFRKRMGRLSLYRHGDDREKAQPCKGTGRYAFEHWIHSHPTNRPCDLYTSSNFTWNYGGLPTELNDDDFRLMEAPRFPSLKTYDDPTVCPIPPLEHRLQEFRELYDGQIPPEDTWWGYRMYNGLLLENE